MAYRSGWPTSLRRREKAPSMLMPEVMNQAVLRTETVSQPEDRGARSALHKIATVGRCAEGGPIKSGKPAVVV